MPNEKNDKKEETKEKEVKMAAPKGLALLVRFKTVPGASLYANDVLDQIKQLFAGKLTETKFSELTNQITRLSNDSIIGAIKVDEITFAEALRQTLRLLPVNLTNLETLENISLNNADTIILSDRYQYDIHFLVNWINSTGAYIHPHSRLPLELEDQKSIYEFADEKKLPIIDFRVHTRIHPTKHKQESKEREVKTDLSKMTTLGVFSTPRTTLTVQQIKEQLVGSDIKDKEKLIELASLDAKNASLILKESSFLQKCFMDGKEDEIKANLIKIALAGVDQASLILEDSNLRPRMLKGNPQEISSILNQISNRHSDLKIDALCSYYQPDLSSSPPPSPSGRR